MTMKTLFDSDGIRLEADEVQLALSGQPDFDNAAELAEAGKKWLGRRSDGVSIDLCGVESASTATLSVLLEWQRHLADYSGHITHLRLSSALSRLAAVSGLESFLPGLESSGVAVEAPASIDTA